MKIVRVLEYSDLWKDYVLPLTGDNVDLMLCPAVVHKLFGITDLIIQVEANSNHLMDGIRVYRGDSGHWFVESGNREGKYTRHYIYGPARALLEPLFDHSISGSIWVTIDGLDDE